MNYEGKYEATGGTGSYSNINNAIGCIRELDIQTDRPNELGSGISLGHPIGCTGARQMVTGMNHMKRQGYHTGIITMCIGGGMGMAMILDR